MRRSVRRKRRDGFTLLEVLLVVVILSVIAGIVVVNVFGTAEHANKELAKIQVKAIANQVKQYRLQMGSLPTELSALWEKPSDADASKWTAVSDTPNPMDPWGRPYEYKLNGSSFEIRCVGADGQANSDDDITHP